MQREEHRPQPAASGADREPIRGSFLSPPAADQAPAPAAAAAEEEEKEEEARSESAEGGREGSGGGPRVDGAPRRWPAHEDPAGSAAGNPGGPQPEWVTQKSTQEKEEASHPSEEMEGGKEEAGVLPEETGKVHAVPVETCAGGMETFSQASAQDPGSSQRDPGGQLKDDFASPPHEAFCQVVSSLQTEIKELKDQLCLMQKEMSCLKQDMNEKISLLMQKVEKLENSQGASGPQLMPQQRSTPVKVFSVQFRTSGKTGGCEQKFLHEVSNLLSKQFVSLKAKEFTETSSKDLLLLVFCPIASRMGTDIQNALEGHHGLQKVLLVVMHYVRKDITEISIDPKQQVSHPALVQAVHTRYTLQDGFYPCEMNQRAMADVADAIKKFAEDN